MGCIKFRRNDFKLQGISVQSIKPTLNRLTYDSDRSLLKKKNLKQGDKSQKSLSFSFTTISLSTMSFPVKYYICDCRHFKNTYQ